MFAFLESNADEYWIVPHGARRSSGRRTRTARRNRPANEPPPQSDEDDEDNVFSAPTTR